jgi:hypothetical protein
VKKPNQSSSAQRTAPRRPLRRLAATSPAPVYTRKSPASQERAAMRKFAPPPQRIASVERNTGSSSSNQESPTVKPIVPQVKMMPPPLPPRSVSVPPTLAEEGVENKPKLPPRSHQRPTVPRKSQVLSLSSPKLAPDIIKSPRSILPHHGRSVSSPVGALVSTGTLSLTLGVVAADSDRDQSSPATSSSISSPGFGISPSSIRSGRSSPRTPTSFVGDALPPISKAEEALSYEMTHLETL